MLLPWRERLQFHWNCKVGSNTLTTMAMDASLNQSCSGVLSRHTTPLVRALWWLMFSWWLENSNKKKCWRWTLHFQHSQQTWEFSIESNHAHFAFSCIILICAVYIREVLYLLQNVFCATPGPSSVHQMFLLFVGLSFNIQLCFLRHQPANRWILFVHSKKPIQTCRIVWKWGTVHHIPSTGYSNHQYSIQI